MNQHQRETLMSESYSLPTEPEGVDDHVIPAGKPVAVT